MDGWVGTTTGAASKNEQILALFEFEISLKISNWSAWVKHENIK